MIGQVESDSIGFRMSTSAAGDSKMRSGGEDRFEFELKRVMRGEPGCGHITDIVTECTNNYRKTV